MKRAVQDVRRIIKVREEKAPLAALVRSGCVGEELLANIEAAEEALNAECDDVAIEAEMIRPGWAKTIFQEASQLANRQIQVEKEVSEKKEEEKYLPDAEEDEMRRNAIAEELLREEEEEANKSGPTSHGAPEKKKNKKKKKSNN